MNWLRRLEQWLLLRRLDRAIDAAARSLSYHNPPAPRPDGNRVHLPRRNPHR